MKICPLCRANLELVGRLHLCVPVTKDVTPVTVTSPVTPKSVTRPVTVRPTVTPPPHAQPTWRELMVECERLRGQLAVALREVQRLGEELSEGRRRVRAGRGEPLTGAERTRRWRSRVSGGGMC